MEGRNVSDVDKISPKIIISEVKDCGPASCRIDKCGDMVWTYAEFIAGVYSQWGDEESRRFAIKMLANIHLMVPCGKCQVHTRRNALKFGLRKKLEKAGTQQLAPLDKGSMFAIIVEFHNLTNKQLRHPIISLETAFKKYEHCFVGKGCSLEDVESDKTNGGCFTQTQVDSDSDNATSASPKIIALAVIATLLAVGVVGLVGYTYTNNKKRGRGNRVRFKV